MLEAVSVSVVGQQVMLSAKCTCCVFRTKAQWVTKYWHGCVRLATPRIHYMFDLELICGHCMFKNLLPIVYNPHSAMWPQRGLCLTFKSVSQTHVSPFLPLASDCQDDVLLHISRYNVYAICTYTNCTCTQLMCKTLHL